MQFDSGEVLQGMDDPWTMLGATLMEWACGMIVFMLISLFATTPGRAMPFMLIGWIITTLSLASLRKMFPDQERGVGNAIMVSCGFPPLNIPLPSALQPYWSSAPLREVPQKWKMVKLGLNEIVPSFQRVELEVEDDEES